MDGQTDRIAISILRVSLLTRDKNCYKFWWSEELSSLKAKAIKSNKIEKEARRPRSRPIADPGNTNNISCWTSVQEAQLVLG